MNPNKKRKSVTTNQPNQDQEKKFKPSEKSPLKSPLHVTRSRTKSRQKVNDYTAIEAILTDVLWDAGTHYLPEIKGKLIEYIKQNKDDQSFVEEVKKAIQAEEFPDLDTTEQEIESLARTDDDACSVASDKSFSEQEEKKFIDSFDEKELAKILREPEKFVSHF